MRPSSRVRMLQVAIFLLALPALGSPAEPSGEAGRSKGGSVSLFDTRTRLPATLSADVRPDETAWEKVPEDETGHKFQGDAVVVSDRLAVVLRRGGPGAELYSIGAGGLSMRATAAPSPGGFAVRVESLAIVENTPDAVAVDAQFSAPGGKTLEVRYRLDRGQVFVRTEARRGAQGLLLAAPCRFLVLPDFFADDIVVDAAEIPVSQAELPSENFLLHLLPGGQCAVMTVTNSREEDARITLAGSNGGRMIGNSEIPCGKDGKVWVAVIEGPGVWHEHDVAASDAGKVLRLDWKTPYPAQWRVDWRRTDRLSSSWEMAAERASGNFEKYGLFGSPATIPRDRKRWATVLGGFNYPCWVDRSGQGYLQPLTRVLKFEGPAVVYPINRVRETPLEAFTVVDLVRATLGVGPCEYILDLEGQTQTMKGRSTCGTRDALGAIYAKGQQKQRRAEIEKILGEVLVFVKHIRGRIEDYVVFGHEMLKYLEEQKKAHPQCADFIAEMETLTRAIDAGVDRRRANIKTPDYVAALTEKFRNTLLDYEGDDALARCKAITEAIVVVGGNQDELVGECRQAVKILRQRAGLAMAADPRAAEVAKEIRRRTQKILRNPTSYEAPRQ